MEVAVSGEELECDVEQEAAEKKLKAVFHLEQAEFGK